MALLGASATAHAVDQSAPPPQSESPQTISVTPVMGTGIPLNQVPSNVKRLHAPQFDLVNASGPEFRGLVEAALFTECRYGDLCALQVGDFDAEN